MSYCLGMPELASTKCVRSYSRLRSKFGYAAPTPAATDMIVWPEAPNDFLNDPRRDSSLQFRAAMSNLARAADAPIIVGDHRHSMPTRRWSEGTTYITPPTLSLRRQPSSGAMTRCISFRSASTRHTSGCSSLPGACCRTSDYSTRASAGRYSTTGGHTYGTFICYESVFADEIRQYADMGADVLVNISDDGWYGDTSAAWEHLNMVRMRAIENHRWVLRATNTGVTAAIDPYGRVVMAAPRHIRTSLRVGFDYEHDVTFYAAHGDLFAYLCALVTAAGLGLSLFAAAVAAATEAITLNDCASTISRNCG